MTSDKKKKPSAVAGKVSFCFGASVGARAQNVRGNFLTTCPFGRPAQSHVPAGADGPLLLGLGRALLGRRLLRAALSGALAASLLCHGAYLLSCPTNLRGANF